MVDWATERFGRFVDADALREIETRDSQKDLLVTAGRELLRAELTHLEQWVLLQIYDQCWKDHLRDMDHKKDEVMQRSITDRQEQHPQSRFAQEGGELFQEMLATIRERVTDIIFKIRIGGEEEDTSPQGKGSQMQTQHAETVNAGFAGAAADRAAAMQAQGDGSVTETIRREQPKVGRNAPCPCGSGKKFKQCCGKK